MYLPAIYQDIFSTPQMRSVWSEANLVQCWLDVEAALAQAEAEAGLIPAQAVPAIRAACRVEKIDLAMLKQGTELVGYPILPLVRQVASLADQEAGVEGNSSAGLEETPGKFVHWGAAPDETPGKFVHWGAAPDETPGKFEHWGAAPDETPGKFEHWGAAPDETPGKFVHWGATTQDIMDTGTVLQARQSLQWIEASLVQLIGRLSGLARQHRMTVMAGRTHGQQALPITFGYKLAVTIAELRRSRARLQDLRPRLFFVEFAGAAGTLASIGAPGLNVQENLARLLGLSVPPIAWHTSRDGLAELVCCLGLLGACLSKLAEEIAFMQRTEVGEVEEGYLPGRGSSSTMPQKRNPITCEAIIGAGIKLRHLLPAALDFMLHDNERATGPWHTEWLALPEACLLADGMLANANSLLAGLVVHPQRMRKNLGLTGGLINAEAVMMALAPILGRQHAHDVVYSASMRAVQDGSDLRTVLLADSEVTDRLSPAEIDRLLEPESYLGLAGEFVDRVIGG